MRRRAAVSQLTQIDSPSTQLAGEVDALEMEVLLR